MNIKDSIPHRDPAFRDKLVYQSPDRNIWISFGGYSFAWVITLGRLGITWDYSAEQRRVFREKIFSRSP